METNGQFKKIARKDTQSGESDINRSSKESPNSADFLPLSEGFLPQGNFGIGLCSDWLLKEGDEFEDIINHH
jgi:hypothetical protein